MTVSCISRLREIFPNYDGSSLQLDIIFTGNRTEMPDGPVQAQTLVVLDGTATAAEIRLAVSLAVKQAALDNGLVILGNNMLLPGYQKGV